MGFSQEKGKNEKRKLEEWILQTKKKLYGIPYSFMTCPGIEPGFTP